MITLLFQDAGISIATEAIPPPVASPVLSSGTLMLPHGAKASACPSYSFSIATEVTLSSVLLLTSISVHDPFNPEVSISTEAVSSLQKWPF